MNPLNKYYKQINQYIKERSGNLSKKNRCYYFTLPNLTHLAISTISIDKFIYGIQPNLNTSEILFKLRGPYSVFSKTEMFSDWIDILYNNNAWCWGEKKLPIFENPMYTKALLARGVLSVVNRFHILFFVNDNDVTKIKHILDSNHIWCEITQQNVIAIYGRPLNMDLERAALFYEFCDVQGLDTNYKLCLLGTNYLADIYNSDYTYYECKYDALYSGINNRLLKVVEKEDITSNKYNNYLCMQIEMTTYFTTLAFESIELNDHPCLKTFLPFLEKIDDYENTKQVELFRTLYNEDKDEVSSLIALNKYLDQSLHTHYINVSSNLTTSDGYLIYTKRGKNAEDALTYYCSANGVSEAYSEMVEYYNYSVNVDIPTIKYNNYKSHSNFGGELAREACAELGVSISTNQWKYYGFSCMGNMTDDNHFTCAIHFNILAEQTLSHTFKDVTDLAKGAIEDFENERIYAVKYVLTKTRLEELVKEILRFLKLISEHSDLVVFLGFIVINVERIKSFNFAKELETINLSTIILIITIFLSIKEIVELIKESYLMLKFTKVIKIKQSFLERKIELNQDKLVLKKYSDQSHIINTMMQKLYLISKMK